MNISIIFMKTQIFHQICMASEVNKGHMSFFFNLRFFVKILILSKLFMNTNIMEDTHLHENEHDLKVHEMYIRLV